MITLAAHLRWSLKRLAEPDEFCYSSQISSSLNQIDYELTRLDKQRYSSYLDQPQANLVEQLWSSSRFLVTPQQDQVMGQDIDSSFSYFGCAEVITGS